MGCSIVAGARMQAWTEAPTGQESQGRAAAHHARQTPLPGPSSSCLSSPSFYPSSLLVVQLQTHHRCCGEAAPLWRPPARSCARPQRCWAWACLAWVPLAVLWPSGSSLGAPAPAHVHARHNREPHTWACTAAGTCSRQRSKGDDLLRDLSHHDSNAEHPLHRSNKEPQHLAWTPH